MPYLTISPMVVDELFMLACQCVAQLVAASRQSKALVGDGCRLGRVGIQTKHSRSWNIVAGRAA